jgi:hypothetical protein
MAMDMNSANTAQDVSAPADLPVHRVESISGSSSSKRKRVDLDMNDDDDGAEANTIELDEAGSGPMTKPIRSHVLTAKIEQPWRAFFAKLQGAKPKRYCAYDEKGESAQLPQDDIDELDGEIQPHSS